SATCRRRRAGEPRRLRVQPLGGGALRAGGRADRRRPSRRCARASRRRVGARRGRAPGALHRSARGGGGSRRAFASLIGMSLVTETIQLKGITCGRCVMRLRHVLKDHDGLESANANLMGELTVTYDDERTSREALLKDVARGGFKETG